MKRERGGMVTLSTRFLFTHSWLWGGSVEDAMLSLTKMVVVLVGLSKEKVIDRLSWKKVVD